MDKRIKEDRNKVEDILDTTANIPEEPKEIKITFEKMLEVSEALRKFLNADKETKFTYAINKFYKLNIKKVFDEYNEELAGIRVDSALVEEKTRAIVYDKETARGFAYDKEGLKAVMSAEKALQKKWETKEFTVIPYKAKANDVPELTQSEEELLKGLVF